MMIVALLGTTISPYLFFWQASQEVEELRLKGKGQGSETKIRSDLRRVKRDTYVGMFFSNAIAFFIMVLGAVVLYAAGIRDVTSAAQAAQALRPLAGEFAFALFAGGIIATGLLAVPVLASSAAYAVAEAFGWPEGLERQWFEAKRFYAIITLATVVGTGLDFTAIDPMKALYWSAVINGVVAVPIMVGLMLLAGKKSVMGNFTSGLKTTWFGWGGDGFCGADDVSGYDSSAFLLISQKYRRQMDGERMTSPSHSRWRCLAVDSARGTAVFLRLSVASLRPLFALNGSILVCVARPAMPESSPPPHFGDIGKPGKRLTCPLYS